MNLGWKYEKYLTTRAVRGWHIFPVGIVKASNPLGFKKNERKQWQDMVSMAQDDMLLK